MKFYHFRKRWTTTKQAVWPSSVEESASDIEEFSIAKSYTFELISYTFFFVAIIIMASGANEENALHFRNAMKEVLFSDSIEVSQEFKVDYENFLTTAEFWSYFGNNLFSNLFNNGTHNDDEPGFRFLENNVIMGPPRLRQLRVRNGSCHVHSDFISYFSNCYSAYSSSDEEKEEKFHGWELGANVYKGEVCTYYGGGYVIPLTYNLTEIQDIFQDLERNQWIDRGTRLVLVEFSILNNPANLLASIKASAEFLATGGFVNSHRIETVELFSIFSDNNFSSKFLIFTIFVLSLIQISANVNTIFSVDGATRVKNPFNTISLWICLILWPCALYEYCHHYYVRILAEQLRRNPDEFVNLDIIVFINNIYLHALALSSLMLGIKFLRIMSLTRALFPFTTTIATCWRDICGFMVIYTIIVLAFVRLGLLLFGENSADFKDYEHTFFHILRCLNGEYDYLQLEHKFGWSASLFFITFTILLYFIFFNMFVAILSNAYKKGTQGKLSFFRFFSIFGNKWVVPQVTMIRQMLKQLFWRKWLQKHDTIANMMAKADFDDFPEYDQEET